MLNREIAEKIIIEEFSKAGYSLKEIPILDPWGGLNDGIAKIEPAKLESEKDLKKQCSLWMEELLEHEQHFIKCLDCVWCEKIDH